MRVFLGHPKGWDDETIDLAVRELAADMTSSLEKAVEVISGRDDFQKNIAAEGNFNGWCRSITRRTDQYGRRFYDVVAVPKVTMSGTVGKATAMIVRDALQHGLPAVQVEWLETGGIEVRPVTAVEDEDTENYIAGWRLVTTDVT